MPPKSESIPNPIWWTIIELDYRPHRRIITRANDNSGIGLVVNMVMGNSILVAMTNMNSKRAVKYLAAIMNVVICDDVLPCLKGLIIRWYPRTDFDASCPQVVNLIPDNMVARAT